MKEFAAVNFTDLDMKGDKGHNFTSLPSPLYAFPSAFLFKKKKHVVGTYTHIHIHVHTHTSKCGFVFDLVSW